jgi:hypothetical protein
MAREGDEEGRSGAMNTALLAVVKLVAVRVI